jgi:hypothetical protein
MSASLLLAPGSNKINGAYLPTGPAPTHPYVENPFQDAVDGGNEALTNVGSLAVGQTTVGAGRIASFAGNVELTSGGELYCTEINTTSSANVNYLTITGGVGVSPPGAQISVENAPQNPGTQNDVLIINGDTNGKLYYSATTNPPVGPYYEIVPVKQYGQATLNAGTVTVNIPGATGSSVIVATCIGQITSQSSTVVVMSVGTPNAGDVVFQATDVSDNRTFNYVCFA